MTEIDLVERLRDNDPKAWESILNDIAEKVLKAVNRRCGIGTNWYELSDLGQSIARTMKRRLNDGDDPKLLSIETPEQLVRWMVVVAHNRFIDQIRKAGAEKRAIEHYLKIRLEELGRDTSARLVAEFEQTLQNPDEVVVFRGWLERKTVHELADELGCSPRKVSNLRTSLIKRFRQLELRDEPNADSESP